MSAEHGQDRRHQAAVINGRLYFGYGLTRQFRQQAIAENAHLNIPQRDILDSYYDSCATCKDLARFYLVNGRQVGRQRIGEIITEGMYRLWQNCSPAAQQLFPFESLIIHKPRLGKVSSALGSEYGYRQSVCMQLASMFHPGITVQEIMGRLPLSARAYCQYRGILRSWGINLPYIDQKREEIRQWALALQSPLTDEQKQDLFAKINVVGYSRLRKLSRGAQPLLIPIKSLVQRAGFHCKFDQLQLFIQAMGDSQVPVGELSRPVKSGPQQGVLKYYFIASQDLSRGTEYLLGRTDLQRFLVNPVKQVCGEAVKIPSTQDLRKKKGVDTVSRVLTEMGIRINKGSKLTYGDFVGPDCQVQIFCYRGRLYYHKGQEDSLRRHLLFKLAALGE